MAALTVGASSVEAPMGWQMTVIHAVAHKETEMNIRSAKARFTLVTLGLLAAAILMAGCATPVKDQSGAISSAQVELRQDMRKLWEDHVTWTRLVIVSTAAGLPDLDATTQRLLGNQADLGNAIKPYYGDEAGNNLTTLLHAHIVGAASLMAAAKGKDPGVLESAKTSWYANGDEIASFLSAANPKAWPVADMTAMMREHLDLTFAEAVDQLEGRYPESVAGYDKVHDSILRMADMLSAGIIGQFPDRF